VLAAIIYVNLQGMMKQFGDICSLWRTNKVDMVRENEEEKAKLMQHIQNRPIFKQNKTAGKRE